MEVNSRQENHEKISLLIQPFKAAFKSSPQKQPLSSEIAALFGLAARPILARIGHQGQANQSLGVTHKIKLFGAIKKMKERNPQKNIMNYRLGI